MFVPERQMRRNGNVVTRDTVLSASQKDQISRADTSFIATDHSERGADVSQPEAVAIFRPRAG